MRAFAYGGAERIDDGRFAYEYDDRGRMIRATEKGAGRRIHYFYSGNNRVVGRRAEYGPPYRLEDRPEILAEDGVPPDVTYVWDPITDRIAAIFKTGSSQNPSIDPNGGLVRQIIHGGLGYDDPIEVVYADPSTGKVARMHPVFDEPAAGGLQLLANGEGEVVSRQVTQDPYGGEESALAGAGVDKITVTARKSDAGTLESVQVDVRLTEEIAAATLAAGARIEGTAVAPSLANPFTIRWSFTPAEWSALPSLTIQITNELRAAAWADSTLILPPPDWALASKPVSTSASIPFEYRESQTSLATWLATVNAGESRSTTLYEVENLATLGSKEAANLTRLIVASTFQALPFTDPATGLVYARERWLDPRTGTFLSPDPMGYVDSSNLYTAFAADPVNNRDPRGEAVYVVYREFADDQLKKLYPAVGHFYLTFDAEGLPDPERWRRLVNRLGPQKMIGLKRNANPDAETFSFHPTEVLTGDRRNSLVRTAYTEGSYIGHNDAKPDQETFVRARTALNMKSPVPFIKFEASGAKIWRIPATQEQQEQLYIAAIAERNSINSGLNQSGSYLLGTNNCGSWAQSMIERAGLPWPMAARVCNLGGAGVGGPADVVTPALTGGLAIVGVARKKLREFTEGAAKQPARRPCGREWCGDARGW